MIITNTWSPSPCFSRKPNWEWSIFSAGDLPFLASCWWWWWVIASNFAGIVNTWWLITSVCSPEFGKFFIKELTSQGYPLPAALDGEFVADYPPCIAHFESCIPVLSYVVLLFFNQEACVWLILLKMNLLMISGVNSPKKLLQTCLILLSLLLHSMVIALL